MKTYKKFSSPAKCLLKQFMAAILTLPPQMAFAVPLAPDPLVKIAEEAAQKYLAPGSSGSVDVAQQVIDGVTVYHVAVSNCLAPGIGCSSTYTNTYRESTAMAEIDGYFYVTTTTDSFPISVPLTGSGKDRTLQLVPADGSVKRLDFNMAVGKINSQTGGLTDKSLRNLRLPPSIVDELAPIMPALRGAVQANIDDLNRSMATSRAMHEMYQNSLKSLGSVAARFETAALETAEIRKLQSGMSAVAMGQALKQASFGQMSSADQKALSQFEKMKEDQFGFRKYELTDLATEKLLKSFDSNLKNGNLKDLVKDSEVLLHLTDLEKSKAFANEMSPAFKDGVVQVGEFNTRAGAAPLDGKQMRTSLHSPAGQAVRRVANLAQTHWNDANGFKHAPAESISTYVAGLAMLSSAESAFLNGEDVLGFKSLDFAKSLLDGTSGFTNGIAKSAENLVELLPTVAKAGEKIATAFIDDPAAAVEQAGVIISKTPEFIEGMVVALVNEYERFEDGDAFTRGEILGQLSGDILIGILTEGALGVAGAAAKGTRVFNSASKSAEALQKVLQKSPELENAITRNLDSVVQSAAVFNGHRGAQLIKHGLEKPALVTEIANAANLAVNLGNPRAADYLARAMLADSPSVLISGGARKTIQEYLRLEKAIQNVPGRSVEFPITRGIPREVMVNGKKILNDESHVFKIHGGNKSANNRYSLGGPEGNEGLYGTVGEGPGTWDTVLNEIEKLAPVSDDLVFKTVKYRSDNILDLTNPAVLKTLNLNPYQLELKIDTNAMAYASPQLLGDIAKNKYDGILFNSAQTTHPNILLFSEAGL